ncbi:phospholipase effector Tle1 domain-containing protein [Bradyrhizobium sp. sBnM-33]|uniref:phospholipase effector Tle1 domain-containing protein n=1 Tax=Bradyrhizobium sp. sBnM-33 TaxID=2831780 RepID=UPI001BCECF4D|nr:DUF2235 domain-containing protein [Bradyrhizobium sp. sBnM-33]WOH52960.1 DUF2235 domain-containing protein [Bradyrhizobium sp. sBnM-33]
MKRLVFCFDGTWNALNADTPTNVVLTAASIVRETRDGITQIIHYDEGVGTGRLEKLSGGMFGAGLIENVREAYRFLIFNYDPKDEIFVFGFSRGAFSARTFVNFVRHVGPLRRLHAARIDEALDLYRERLSGADGASERTRKFRADYSSNVCVGTDDDSWRCQNVADYQKGSAPVLTIKYLGVWDTVAALGFPEVMPFSQKLNNKYAFHDASLSDFVESARHAVAIDERRALFPPATWSDLTAINAAKNYSPDHLDAPYQEKWFPGTHGSVGGGGDIRGLSDGALAWVLKGAKRAGLVLDAAAGSRIQGFAPNALVPLVNMSKPEKSFTNVITTDRKGPDHRWQLSAAALRRYKASPSELPDRAAYRPRTLSKLDSALASYVIDAGQQDTNILAEHVVVSGDQLRKLAKHYYGDAEKWKIIFDANRDTIDDADELFVGWKLRIPALASTEQLTI